MARGDAQSAARSAALHVNMGQSYTVCVGQRTSVRGSTKATRAGQPATTTCNAAFNFTAGTDHAQLERTCLKAFMGFTKHSAGFLRAPGRENCDTTYRRGLQALITHSSQVDVL